ncbi:MAG: hypothetical protein JSS65_03390 [Armatimonadetes bacterium]|nr:hypothetical protein [Armatimonadota bacterium]
MAVVYATVNGRLVQESRGGVVTRYVSDTLGSCVQTRDSAGTLTSTAEYWPYGEVRTSTGSNPSAWGFVGLLGYLTDTVSRLYVRMRHYRPGLIRWQTVDPYFPNARRYRYCRANPVRWSDKWGLRTAIAEPDKCMKPPKSCSDLLTEGTAGGPLKDIIEDCISEAHGNPDKIIECLGDLIKSPIKIGKDLLIDKLFEYLACIYGSSLPGGTPNVDPCASGEAVLCCAGKQLACQVKCIYDSKDDPFGFKHAFCKWKCYAEAIQCLIDKDSVSV